MVSPAPARFRSASLRGAPTSIDNRPGKGSSVSLARQAIRIIPIERTRSVTSLSGHRQAASRLRGAPHRDAIRGSQHAAVCEQPRRGFASTDATARATDAPVQICRARAAVSLGPQTRAESLPGRATSPSVGAPPPASDAGVRRMGCGDVCLLNDEGYRAIEGSSRPPLINLTVPLLRPRVFLDT